MESQEIISDVHKIPKTWKIWLIRSAGFGVGFAVGLAVLAGAIMWYVSLPKTQPQWNPKAITAKYTDLTAQRRDTQVHVVFRFALTNTTNVDYLLPTGVDGVLMKGVPQGGYQKLKNVTWDSHVSIPAKKVVNVEFDLPIDPSEYNIKPEELDGESKLIPFMGRRLKEIDGLVFFDYVNRYEIDMPNGWKDIKTDPATDSRLKSDR